MEHQHTNHQHDHGGHSATLSKTTMHHHINNEHSRPAAEHGNHHMGMIDDFRKRFFGSLVLTIPIVALTPMLQHIWGLRESFAFPGDSYVLLAFSTAIFIYGGLPFINGAANELAQARPGMMTLVAVAITTAFIYSALVVLGLQGDTFFWELATLIDIMLLGHWIEMKSVIGASKALEELATLVPADAHKVTADGMVVDTPVSALVKGDLLLVKPGERIPADALVVSGETSIDESLLTGESEPVRKLPGAVVIGGAINGEGSIKIEVQKIGKDSFIAQVTELVRAAQASKSRTQDLANRAASWLTMGAIVSGGVTFAAWLGGGRDLAWALERAVTVLVISCPHALGLAVPLVVSVSTAIAAKHGLIVRDRAAFEVTRNVGVVVFDKTGTLTTGKFSVTDIITLSPRFTREEVIRYAASVEQNSEHPIALSIVKASDSPFVVEGFKAIPGKGAQGTVNGRAVKVVSPGYVASEHINIDDPAIDQLFSAGKTAVFVLIDGQLAGVIALADTVREESKKAVAALKAMGIRCVMLTGDNKLVAARVAKEVGLDEYVAEVLPHEKEGIVREIQSRGLVVAMTGDGVNDAPALAQADVGIAVGAGTDVAIATADIILIRSNPLDVVHVIKLARSTYRKMGENLIWATGYNAVAIPLAAGLLYPYGVFLSPAIGAVLMSLSTVIVAINAQLLKIED
jgi:Cu2+-exporting ATPase